VRVMKCPFLRRCVGSMRIEWTNKSENTQRFVHSTRCIVQQCHKIVRKVAQSFKQDVHYVHRELKVQVLRCGSFCHSAVIGRFSFPTVVVNTLLKISPNISVLRECNSYLGLSICRQSAVSLMCV